MCVSVDINGVRNYNYELALTNEITNDRYKINVFCYA